MTCQFENGKSLLPSIASLPTLTSSVKLPLILFYNNNRLCYNRLQVMKHGYITNCSENGYRNKADTKGSVY